MFKFSVTSIGIPSNSPWRVFETTIASQYNDLTATPLGMVVNAEIKRATINTLVVACNSDQGKFFTTTITLPSEDPSTWDQASLCSEQASFDASVMTFTNITPLGIYYLWSLRVQTDPTVATTGGVTVESASVGNLFGVSFNQTASSLNIGAGASPSISPAPVGVTLPSSAFNAQYGHILMSTNSGDGWSSYAAGGLCADGSTPSGNPLLPECPGSSVLASCAPIIPDLLLFTTNTTKTNYSLNCGITINFTMTGAYPTVGSCIDTSIKSNCGGLKGKDRSVCVTANIGVCQASFNIPSALAR